MRFKMRKVKSWLRWAKKRLEEKHSIKIHKFYFQKSQLKMVLKFRESQRKNERLKDDYNTAKLFTFYSRKL